MGFRGSKKNTPYAAQTAAEDCAKVAQEAGLRQVKVYVKGPETDVSLLSVPFITTGLKYRNHRRYSITTQRLSTT